MQLYIMARVHTSTALLSVKARRQLNTNTEKHNKTKLSHAGFSTTKINSNVLYTRPNVDTLLKPSYPCHQKYVTVKQLVLTAIFG